MKNMRRWIACLAVVLLCMQPAMADEGMWLGSTVRGVIFPQMKKEAGGDLSADEGPGTENQG